MTSFASPYARLLGLTRAVEHDRLIVTMPFGDGVLGRPGFLHGGAMAGLLDYAGWATLLEALGEGDRIKPIAVSVDFLRGGKLVDTYAAAEIVRLGRRIANVVATAWQEDEAKPIARADMKFLIERRG